jgi:hypothetical protein
MIWFATALELIGLVLVTIAAFMVWPPLGIAVGGVVTFAVGWFLERD